MIARRALLAGNPVADRLLAVRIPNAGLAVWPEGGHIWPGHDANVALEISTFLRGIAG